MSGKPFALIQHLEEILETGEKILIFSPYTQALFLLQKLLREQLGDDPLVLHDQAAAECAEECRCNVSDAPSRHIFLISPKAGDTGLNLTAASRVIHFDLWYNPAIEDQAIGCAFRIGQCRTVFASRFICAGGIEENARRNDSETTTDFATDDLQRRIIERKDEQRRTVRTV